MPDPDSLSTDDRVLLLGAPDLDLALGITKKLSRGLLVIMCEPAQVAEGRRRLRDAENVMFVPFEGDSIPWQDGFFTVVADLRGDWPETSAIPREIARVRTASN